MRFVCLFFLAALLGAQDSGALRISLALLSENGGLISVTFSREVTLAGPQADPTLVRLVHSGNSRISGIGRSFLERTVVSLRIEPPIAEATDLKVCFPRVRYIDAVTKKEVINESEVCADVKKGAREAREAVLSELTAVPKNSDEKTIFASGFVTTGTGAAAGGGDISLNPNLHIDGMTTFLNLKKTTETGGDLKHIEFGARYQTVLPWGRGLIGQIANSGDLKTMIALLDRQQEKLLAGVVYDMAAKLEGDPANFQVTNLVGDTGLSLRSMTKSVGGKGYWRGFLTPLGFEGGRSMGRPPQDTPGGATTVAHDYVARYKAGAGMTLFYSDWSNRLPFKRIELDTNAVVRDLFFNEAIYNPKTLTATSMGKGIRGYSETNIKVFFGRTEGAISGRYGFRLSYERGSLPPVFARVKCFQFGFLFETADDTTAKK